MNTRRTVSTDQQALHPPLVTVRAGSGKPLQHVNAEVWLGGNNTKGKPRL